MTCIDWSVTHPTNFTLHCTCSLVIFIALSCVLYTLVMLIFTKVAWKLIYMLHELNVTVLWDNYIIMIPYMHAYMHLKSFQKAVWSAWQQNNASFQTKAELHSLPQQSMYNMCWWYVFFWIVLSTCKHFPTGASPEKEIHLAAVPWL